MMSTSRAVNIVIIALAFFQLFASGGAMAARHNPGGGGNAAPSDFYDVKRTGTKGDGVQDDSIFITTAMALATQQGYKGLYFPPGTYAHSKRIGVLKTLSLLGAGNRSSVLLATGSNNELTVQIQAGANCTISDLGITRRGEGLADSPGCTGIYTNTATNFTIKNCIIGQGFRAGIYVEGPNPVPLGTITQNDFQIAKGGAGLVISNVANGVTVSENRFVGVLGASGIEMGKVSGLAQLPANKVSIIGNSFTGINEAVHTEGNSSNVVLRKNVIMPAEFDHRSAIRIGAGPGTANSSIDIQDNDITASNNSFDSGIVLTGANSNITMVANDITGAAFEGIGVSGQNANITIDQNKITGAEIRAVSVDASGDTHDITITRNIVNGKLGPITTRNAILVRGGRNYNISNNVISDTRGGLDPSGFSTGGGIAMSANSSSYGTCNISSNRIQDVNLICNQAFPALAVIQIATSNKFDSLKIMNNQYTGNTCGLGYFILCPEVNNLIVAGNKTNTDLPTQIGP